MSMVLASSWLHIDNSSDFSLQNIPFGVFSISSHSYEDNIENNVQLPKKKPRCGSAIGNYAIDLSVLAYAGFFGCVTFDTVDDTADSNAIALSLFSSSTLNDFMAQPSRVWKQIRRVLISLLLDEGGALDGVQFDSRLKDDKKLQNEVLIPLENIVMHLPASIGDYTDFYSSREHATNVGTMFRGAQNALQPNWLHLPVAYHGRSSTIFPSGTDIVRPSGQLQIDPADPTKGSKFGPCKLLDFELEMAFFVGGSPAIRNSKPLTIEEAERHIFGFCLMNDWSARDIQKWEYVPLGPFTSKNFATTIAPWIITLEALRPFACLGSAGEGGQVDPVPLDYLRDVNYNTSFFDINLEVSIQGVIQSTDVGTGSNGLMMSKPGTVCRSNYRNLYWNARQQLVHHSVTGCIMKPGDLLGSGTISGKSQDSFGSMLELCWKGTREVPLGDTGEVRKFLKDGDTVIMKGWCQEREGVGRVGFGNCVGRILPVGSELVPGSAVGSWVASTEKVKDIL